MLPLTGFGTYRVKDIETFRTALNTGYKHFDTAELYKNEHLVKHAIDEHISKNNKNDKIYITTKISKKSIYSNKIKESWDQRIKIFGHVDLMLLHVPSSDPLTDWSMMCELYLKDSNNVKWIGVSNYEIEDLERIKHCRFKPAYNQIEISPFCTNHRLVKYCNDNDIKIIAHTCLTNTTKFDNKLLSDSANLLKISVPNLMLSWARTCGYTVIPKSLSYDHMYENLYHGVTLTDEIIRSLNGLNDDFKLIKIKK